MKMTEEQTVTFTETRTVFANPGKGWMSFQRLPGKEPRFPCSVGYFRLDWADLEPAEGRYDWRPLDEAIAAWGKRDAAVAFRVMTTNAHSSGYYCSPRWLFDKGCRHYEYERGGADPTSGGSAIRRIEPDYADPLYLGAHRAFLSALGQRYDGHAGVEFLDIGSYGIWGEWHTSHPASPAVRRQIVDMYLEVFRRTPLVMMSDDAETLAYALSRGTGFRRDGVGSPWHEQNWIGSARYAGVHGFSDTWKHAPVVFEWFGSYDYLQERKWPVDRALRFLLDNHVTLVNDNFGAVPPEVLPDLLDIARRSGYHFVLRRVTHPRRVRAGGRLPLKMAWSNVGVGKLCRPASLAIFLTDPSGRVVHTAVARADPRDWLPGDHVTEETVPLPRALTPGIYSLEIALIDARTRRPAIRLAIDAPETDRRYRISRVTLEKASA